MKLRHLVSISILTLAPLAAAVDSVQVVGLFSGKAVVRVDGKQHLLTAGRSPIQGVKLISANAREAVMEVDGVRNTYRLGGGISSHYAEPETRTLTVQVWPDSGGSYTIAGGINGFPVHFVVDTGANVVALNAGEARRLGIDYRITGDPTPVATASGVANGYAVTLKRVRVGEIELKDVRATVIDGPYPRHVLLGMTFLSRVEMSRKGRLMELTLKY